MKWKIIALLSTSLLLIVVVTFYFHGHFTASWLQTSLDTPAIVTQVQSLKELATAKYTIQRVVGLREEKEPLGEESILLMVQGYALAGVDLSILAPDDVAFKGPRKVELRLPRAALISVYLDEKQTKVWDRHITWWTPWVSPDPQLETKARVAALNDMRSAALQMGILDGAQRNAESAIASFFRALGIEVKFPESAAS